MKLLHLISKLTLQGFDINFSNQMVQKIGDRRLMLQITVKHLPTSGTHSIFELVSYVELEKVISSDQIICDMLENLADHWLKAVVIPEIQPKP